MLSFIKRQFNSNCNCTWGKFKQQLIVIVLGGKNKAIMQLCLSSYFFFQRREASNFAHYNYIHTRVID